MRPSRQGASDHPHAPTAPLAPRRGPALVPAASPRLARLAAELAAGRAGALDAWWADAAAAGTPLIEPHPDPALRTVTFVWRGDDDTGPVLLLANRLTDRRDLAATLLRRLPGSDVWQLSVAMRPDWQASYQIAAAHPAAVARPAAGTAAGPNRAGAADLRHQAELERLLDYAAPDPLFRRSMPSKWGGPAHSVAQLPAARVSPHWTPRAQQPALARGTLSAHEVAGFGRPRTVWVYAPARPAARLDLLVALDGEVWGPVLDLAAALDSAIADGSVRPTLAVLPAAADDPASRARECGCDPAFADFLAGGLARWAAERWPVAPGPERRFVAGQSLSGLAAVHAAWRRPDAFGAALAASGSFWWPSQSAGGEWLTGQIAAAPRAPFRADLAVGQQESLLVGPVRRLRDALAAKGNPVDYTEVNGGHDYAWWRHALLDALARRR